MIPRLVATTVVSVLALTLCGPLAAGVDIDFGANVRLNDNTDLYFAISSRYFDHDRQAVTTLGARYRNPDDLAVALFIGRHSGKSADAIWALRRQGLSWWDISIRFGVPVNVWFVDVARDPGPPYGKAYGHWKKHRHDRRSVVVLSDADTRNLVAVRMIHEYYRVPVDVAMEWRAGGKNVRDLLAGEYHRRHGHGARDGHVAKHKHPPKPGPGKGRGKKH